MFWFKVAFMSAAFGASLLTFGLELKKFDFDWNGVKSIWESPELKEALKKVNGKNERPEGKLTSRIIGGKFSNAGQFPHSIVMLLDEFYVCGGSIINKNWILTVR